MIEEHLTYEKCLERLEHSFLKVSLGNVDFQHPTLRDMLLNLLKDKPDVRHRCIKLASPNGLAEMLSGLENKSLGKQLIVHRIEIKDNTDLILLNKRIKEVLSESLKLESQLRILDSAIMLLPTKREIKVSPSEINLKDFNKCPIGISLNTIIESIKEIDFYNVNEVHDLSNWNEILSRFYIIAPYIFNFEHPKYLSLLIDKIDNSEIKDIVNFISILSDNNPLILNQVCSKELMSYLDNSIKTELNNKIKDSNLIHYDDSMDNYEDEYDYYQNWYNESAEIIEIAKNFYHSVKLKPIEIINELEELIDFKAPPYGDPHEDDYEYETSSDFSEFWTIEKIMEDL